MGQIGLLFLGDIFLRDKNRKKAILSESILDIFRECDIVCGNLEGPIASESKPSIKIGPSICQDEKCLDYLKKNGMNMFSLANNHIMDYGVQGFRKTVSQLKDIYYIGAGETLEDIYSYKKISYSDITVAFLSVAEGGFGVCKSESSKCGYAWMLDKSVKTNIKKAKEECNFVIIFVHAGVEELDVPLPEIRELYRNFIDLGANAVIAHHPHVVQGAEKYKEGMIFYSLGNFAFDSIKNINRPYNPVGIGVSLQISKEKKATWNIVSTYYDGEQIYLDIEERGRREFNASNNIMNDSDKYLSYVNEKCYEMYETIFCKYYAEVNRMNSNGILPNMKRCMKILMGFKMNEYMIYHNIAIETHRWLCIRGLERKFEVIK